MKRSVEEHAERFDALAADYDDEESDEYVACLRATIAHADPGRDDVVLDLGCGTGAVALALAADAGRVVGRDVSDGMLEQAREKATNRGLSNVELGEGRFRDSNVELGEGRFRDPNVEGDVDIVTSNFAMHHLDDAAKRDAIDTIAALDPRRVVLGDVMLWDDVEHDADFYDPAVDDPATVGVLVDAFTDAGYAITEAEMVHACAGVLVAERL